MLITHVEGFVLVLPSDSVRGRVCLKKKKKGNLLSAGVKIQLKNIGLGKNKKQPGHSSFNY